jgi:pyridoxal phosphate enzyme (YggS family)
MPVNTEAYFHIKSELDKKNITFIAVSKTKPVEDIKALYDHGHRDFGENYVQELVDKAAQLPTDIRWHFIGHLQSNKVKYIAPLVQLIHGVDSLKLLKEIGKQAQKNDRVIDCLLQVHIAQEETKFGLDEKELASIMESEPVAGTNVKGLMGMASFTDDKAIVQKEFHQLQTLYLKYPSFTVLSMGMSSDYEIAIEEGSTMVRIGSLLFGAR